MGRANRLKHYIEQLPDFEMQEDVATGYDHMGAILVDGVLQAGIRYETVVLPRVESVLNNYPEAKTTSEFQRVLMIEGALKLLAWKLDRKINTLVDLTQFFVSERLETAAELRDWLDEADNVQRLKEIKGIGDKTADYFKILTGIPTSAIDRHLYKFMAQAGIEVGDYEEAQQVIRETAVLLDVDERTLDFSIWSYMAG